MGTTLETRHGLEHETRLHAAAALVGSLPVADYASNYQPTYDNQEELTEAVTELLDTSGVTTPHQVDAYAGSLAGIATKESDKKLVIAGGCRERIQLMKPIAELARESAQQRDIVLSSDIGSIALYTERGRGQYTKPRSKGIVQLSDGTMAPAYQGDLINSETATPEARRAKPSNLVGGADQARDLEAGLTNFAGEHVPAAHEALSLVYEESFIRLDEESDSYYSLSADMLWAGLRTNNPYGPVVQMLKRIKNPVGVKVGAGSGIEHIRQLREELNPDDEPGKLTYMVRVGLDDVDSLHGIISAIHNEAPNSLKIFDMHGITETLENGVKIRRVNDVIKGIHLMARICREVGTSFDGVHLETITDNSRLECVDDDDGLPTHTGGIDPQLNPNQTRKVLHDIAELLHSR